MKGPQLVRVSPSENLSWQVPAKFAAEGALDADGLEGEFFLPGRHVAAAAGVKRVQTNPARQKPS